MKTNQIMTRKMGEFDVHQRTKDGMFNATSLLQQWGNAHDRKDIDQFFRNDKTKKFMEVLHYEENLVPWISRKNTEPTSYEVAKGNRSKGVPSQYWMHPYLFIKFAMWINPRFEYHVIRFVYDQLIENRHQAGDNYAPFMYAVSTLKGNISYSEPATWLNIVVFNKHTTGIRNTATAEQLREISALEKKYTDLINEGYITDTETLRLKLRLEWSRRYGARKEVLALR